MVILVISPDARNSLPSMEVSSISCCPIGLGEIQVGQFGHVGEVSFGNQTGQGCVLTGSNVISAVVGHNAGTDFAQINILGIPCVGFADVLDVHVQTGFYGHIAVE